MKKHLVEQQENVWISDKKDKKMHIQDVPAARQ